MALTSVLLLAAGFSTNVGIQGPGFDLQFAIPQQSNTTSATQTAQETAPPTVTQVTAQQAPQIQWKFSSPDVVLQDGEDQGKKVSEQFSHATASQLFDWLQQQGVEFVVADGLIPPSTFVTLNVTNEPVSEVADAVAAALGGHWERRGRIRVFKMGAGAPAFAPSMDSGAWHSMGDMNGFMTKGDGDWKMVPDLHFQMSKDMQKQLGPEFQQKMEKMGKDMQNQFGPEFQQKMEQMGKDMQKQFGPDFQKKIEIEIAHSAKQAASAADQKAKIDSQIVIMKADAAKQAAEAANQKAKIDSQIVIMKADAAKQAEIALQHAKIVQGAKDKAFRVDADGKNFRIYTYSDGKYKPAIVKDGHVTIVGKASAKAAPDGTTYRVFTYSDGKYKPATVKDGHITIVGGASAKDAVREANLRKLMDSLTPAQKQMQNMRGYIFYIYLTPEQRKLLGPVPSGKFVAKYKVDGQELTIHGS